MSARRNRPVDVSATTSSSLDDLQQEIHEQLWRIFRVENGYVWLASPQPLVDMRIPARMLASGDGPALLQALRAATPRIL